jgi:hypothetical protein
MSIPFYAVVRAEREVDEETGAPLYWSNGQGWVDAASASSFVLDEVNSLNLPIGGRWELRVSDTKDDPRDII